MPTLLHLAGVDVSCTKKGDSFRGDQASRQHVSLRLIDMLELAEAGETGRPHWATAEDVGLDYYLCQCPVFSREPGKPEVLSAIQRHFRTPAWVSEKDLLQVNLWLGAMSTTTNMHFDANHNLLFVLKGKKSIVLMPPSMTGTVKAMPVFSESPNHSMLEQEDIAEMVGTPDAVRKGAVYADVGEGEAIFIPEGWWHQVTSARGTVGVNVWFKGVRPSLCEGSGHMRLYYLRCLCESLLSERLRGAAASGERAGEAEAEGKVKISGTKRPRLQPLPAEFSPLCSPVSTPEQRNAYLRTMGIGRMREELPRIAREQTAYWARIVTGLDPLTAHVLTAQWEAAGGATGMPDFYGAIFGEDMAPPGAGAEDGGVGDDAVSRFGGATSHAGGDLMESPSTRCDGVVSGRGIGGGVKAAGMEAEFGETSAQAGFGETSAQAEVVQSDDLCGVALQERLIRLKEAFAREEFGKLLRTAVGW
ncbi:unnamed protein product [Ascophyllum nodosum]